MIPKNGENHKPTPDLNMGFPESSSPGNLNSVTSGTLFEVAFLQDMLPSLAIAVTLAADAMTDFWLEQFGLGKCRDAS